MKKLSMIFMFMFLSAVTLRGQVVNFTLLQTGQVVLTWDASSTPGVTYNVYRTDVCGDYNGVNALNTVPITGLTFTDPAVFTGIKCYVVRALGKDENNNPALSGPSNEVSVDKGLTCPNGQFLAEYYVGQFSGNPILRRCEAAVSYNWGDTAPATGVPADNYSVRWTCNCGFNAGQYDFKMTVDDGGRIIVDGVAVIESWVNQGPTTYSGSLPAMTAGTHKVVVEYFENGGGAVMQVSWVQTVLPPTNLKVVFTSPLPSAIIYRGQTVPVSISATGSQKITLLLNNSTVQTANATTLTYNWVPRQRKTFTFTARAWDVANNVTSSSMSITVR